MKWLTNLDLSQNELQNVAIQSLATDPTGINKPLFWFNTTQKVYKGFNGTKVIVFGEKLTGEDIVNLINASASRIDDDNLSTNVNDAISKKHKHDNQTILDATTASFLSTEKTKLTGIAAGAEVNQNAFSNIKIGAVTIAADSKTDTLELIAGTGITLTPDETNDKITIGGTNQYILPVATSSAIGGVKSGTDITVDSNGNVSINENSHDHIIANVTGLQVALDAKETPSGAQSKATAALNSAKSYTDTAVANIVNTAPEALDTLQELADALGNDPNFATTVMTEVGKKVDKVSGKGLSTNDLTNTLKSNYDSAYAKSHEHPNKTVIDGITANKVSSWDTANSHISDPVKHISAQERLNWDAKTNTVSTTIGDGTKTEFTITHNLGTTDVIIGFKEIATNESVMAESFIVDENSIKVIFAVAPTTNQFRVTITGTGTQIAVDGTIIIDGGTF